MNSSSDGPSTDSSGTKVTESKVGQAVHGGWWPCLGPRGSPPSAGKEGRPFRHTGWSTRVSSWSFAFPASPADAGSLMAKWWPGRAWGAPGRAVWGSHGDGAPSPEQGQLVLGSQGSLAVRVALGHAAVPLGPWLGWTGSQVGPAALWLQVSWAGDSGLPQLQLTVS